MSDANPTPETITAIAAVTSSIGAVGKGGKSKGAGGTYNYRRVDDVINALSPVLAEHGVLVVPHEIVERHMDEWGSTKSGARQVKTTLRVQYRVYGPDGGWINAEGVGEGIDTQDKAPGKAMSYAYKYVCNQVFAIPFDDPNIDVEAQQFEHHRGQTYEPAVHPDILAARDELAGKIRECKKECTDEQYETLIGALQRIRAGRSKLMSDKRVLAAAPPLEAITEGLGVAERIQNGEIDPFLDESQPSS